MASLMRSTSCPTLKNTFRVVKASSRRCANCNGKGHNRRSCVRDWGVVLCPPARPIKVKTQPVESVKPAKQVSLIGVSMFKEPKDFYKTVKPTKQVSLIGVSMFNEPKDFYKAVEPTKMEKFVQQQRTKWGKQL